MRCIIFILVLMSLQSGMAQDCFSSFYDEGIKAYNELDFDRAISQFQAARICDDRPGENDLDEWITKTQNAYVEVIKNS